MNNKLGIIISSIVFSILIWGSITLSDDFFSTTDLKIKVINQPSGYACGEINPDDITVKLKARGWQLLSFYLGADHDFFVSANNDSGLIKIDPSKEISENGWIGSGISILDINPKIVSLNIEKIKFKKLKVIADTDLKFSEGYNLATPIKIYPDSILVSGPKGILENLSTIKTLPIKISSLDHNFEMFAELENIRGFQFEEKSVQLIFDVQKIVEKAFNGIKVTINDLPIDREIVLIPNSIDCSLRGGINVLGKLTNDQISASINYSELVYDTTGSIKPNVLIPENTKLVFTKPARLNYIIKKFQ